MEKQSSVLAAMVTTILLCVSTHAATVTFLPVDESVLRYDIEVVMLSPGNTDCRCLLGKDHPQSSTLLCRYPAARGSTEMFGGIERMRGRKDDLGDGTYCLRRTLSRFVYNGPVARKSPSPEFTAWMNARNAYEKTRTWTPWATFTVNGRDLTVIVH